MARCPAVVLATVVAFCAAPFARPQGPPDPQILNLSPSAERPKGTIDARASLAPRRAERSTLRRLARQSALVADTEPNGTFATATPLSGANLFVQGNLFPNGDVDF